MLQWTWECRYLFKILFLFLLDIPPKVGLLGHMAVLFLLFWETCTLFSILAVAVYITTNSAWGLHFFLKILFLSDLCTQHRAWAHKPWDQVTYSTYWAIQVVQEGYFFSTFLPTPAISCLFDDSLLNRCKGYLIVVLTFISWWLVRLSLFSCTCWTFECILWNKCLFRFSVHF